jgi:hypothetical protein
MMMPTMNHPMIGMLWTRSIKSRDSRLCGSCIRTKKSWGILGWWQLVPSKGGTVVPGCNMYTKRCAFSWRESQAVR